MPVQVRKAEEASEGKKTTRQSSSRHVFAGQVFDVA